MKKGILFMGVLMCAMMSLPGCTGTNEPDKPKEDSQKLLCGTWHLVSQSFNDEALDIPEGGWFEFNEDGTYRNIYLYNDTLTDVMFGNYDLQDDELTIYWNFYRCFTTILGIPRITDTWMNYKANASSNTYSIVEVSDKQLKTEYYNHGTYVQTYERVNALPEQINPEFYAAEITPTQDNLVAQWDYVNYTVNNRYWYFYDPEGEGFTLNNDGSFGYIGNSAWVIDMLYQVTTLEENESGLGYNIKNTSWRLEDKYLTIRCSTYFAVTTDESEMPVSQREITPANPVEKSFRIMSYTPYYMILMDESNAQKHILYRASK